MNDDFLRRARRRPSAAFEHQLRERLRQQELASPPRRRPTWGLLIAAFLVGGSALAVTYLTAKHWSSWSFTSEIQPPPAAGSPHDQSGAIPQTTSRSNGTATRPVAGRERSALPPEARDAVVGTTRDGGPASATSSPAGTPLGEFSSLAGGGASSAESIRIALTPELAILDEEFARRFSYRTKPRVEIASADVTLPALCAETSPPPDIVFVTRRIEQSELDACNKQGVLEAKLGHMATVVTGARAGSPMQLSADTVMRALLKRIPSQDDPTRLIENPYTDWSQVSRSVEARRIEVLGPPRDSQHFLVFAATILEPACDKYDWIRALRTTDRRAYEEICHTLRDDGAYKTAPWDNTFVGQRLWADPNIVAIIDYSFYSANSADLIGSLLKGPAPTRRSIRDGSYPATRSLYLYVSSARHARSSMLKKFLDDYLRRNDLGYHQWIVPPTDSSDPRPFSRAPLTLTEVKLE